MRHHHATRRRVIRRVVIGRTTCKTCGGPMAERDPVRGQLREYCSPECRKAFVMNRDRKNAVPELVQAERDLALELLIAWNRSVRTLGMGKEDRA